MMKTDKLSLRVNGQECEHVNLRFKMEGGYPGGPPEAVVTMEPFGSFALTADFTVELKEGTGEWKVVTLPYFIALLRAQEA